MKLTAILLCLSAMAGFASTTYAQLTKLTVVRENSTVKSILNEIEDQSEFRFFFSGNVDVTRKVSVNIKQKKLFEVLDELFNGTGVKYKVYNKQIALIDTSDISANDSFWGQQRSVSGKVTDSGGQPLPGVSVIVKGTTNGTVTNADGEYTLINLAGDAVLQFSFIGMKIKEIEVGTRLVIDIIMKEDVIGLDEVVAIGYGTMRKSDLTGSVSRIDMKDNENQPNINLLEALRGTTAGVNIEGSGGAGSQPTFSIRGQTSLSASNSPLIVIDGIIYNGSLSDINVNDVESIDVLKDASAAAVYGSRSANGVIIINTKRGETERPVVSLNMYYGVQDMTNNPMRVMNGDEFAIRLVDWEYQRQVYDWYKTNPTSAAGRPVRPDVTNRELVANYLRTQEEKDNYLAGDQINWVDGVLQVAPMKEYNLSISGKSGDRVNYYVSGSYSDIEGIQLNDKFKRFTLHSNLMSDINDWLSLNFRSSYAFSDNSGEPASLSAARIASPLVNNYIGQSSYDIYLGGELFQTYPLVYTYIDNSDTRNQLHLVGSAKIEIPWIKGLSNEINYSNLYAVGENDSFNSSHTPEGVANNGLATKYHYKSRDWVLNNIVSYVRTLGEHKVNLTFLYSREGRKGDSSTLSANGFDNEMLGYNNMGLGKNSSVATSAWEENSIAYMGRLNYSYKSRYMVTTTLRRDGFSGFGAENKWAIFPSVSVAWVLSDEPFINKKDDFYAKLRLSYGKNGNQGIGRYSSLSRMGTRYYVYGQETAVGLYPSTLGNSDLSWEKTKSINLGLDYGFFDNRITGSVELYKSKTQDVLVERNLPPTAGYSSVWANIGGIKNKGIEFELRSININKQLHWESSLIFSLNRDKITRLYGEDDDADIGNQWFVGEPISAIYDYKMAGGVWTEEEFFAGKIPLAGWYPGQFRYVDLNTDNQITPEKDRTIVGYAAPSYRFGINNRLSYGNFTLSFFINSVQGGDKYYLANNASNINPLFYMSYRLNCSAINEYWRPGAPTTNTTGIYNDPPKQSGIYQSRSFVRLQDVTFSYRLNKKIIDTLNLSECELYLSSKNPYVWTKWQGWDPETGVSDSPLMRNIIVGVRLSL